MVVRREGGGRVVVVRAAEHVSVLYSSWLPLTGLHVCRLPLTGLTLMGWTQSSDRIPEEDHRLTA